MATTQRIVIEAVPAVNVTVGLVGQEYVIPVPKTTLGLIVAERMQAAKDDPSKLMDELKSWVFSTFGKKQGQKVWDRLFDADDPLDIQHISDLLNKLTELGANPTT
jgi:hypothetical protein